MKRKEKHENKFIFLKNIFDVGSYQLRERLLCQVELATAIVKITISNLTGLHTTLDVYHRMEN